MTSQRRQRRIFLDDVRAAPAGWERMCWLDGVITALETGTVAELSLDHDLGDDARGTGYAVIRWIEEAVVLPKFSPPKIYIHSANPVATARMLAEVEVILNRLKSPESPTC